MSGTTKQIQLQKLTHSLCDIVFEDADMLGEVLMRYVFVGKGRGCYSNFDLNPKFRLWAKGKDKFSDNLLGDSAIYSESEYLEAIKSINSYIDAELDLSVVWDWRSGDGHLIFQLGSIILENTDIKKSYGWRFV
jgi:hypothetical protein